jgi:hypothetical protein
MVAAGLALVAGCRRLGTNIESALASDKSRAIAAKIATNLRPGLCIETFLTIPMTLDHYYTDTVLMGRYRIDKAL